VSGATVTLVSAGPCTIQATQGGNTNWAAAASVTRSFTATKATPTITWPAPAASPMERAHIGSVAGHGKRARHIRLHTARGTVLGAGHQPGPSVAFHAIDATDYNTASAAPPSASASPATVTLGSLSATTMARQVRDGDYGASKPGGDLCL